MKTNIGKLLANTDFLHLKELKAASTDPVWTETKIVIIPHAYRDETIELIALEQLAEIRDLSPTC